VESAKYEVRFFSKKVVSLLGEIPQPFRNSICIAIERKLQTNPLAEGRYLKGGLSGQMRLRVGAFRVVYRVVGSVVIILWVGMRKDAYKGN